MSITCSRKFKQMEHTHSHPFFPPCVSSHSAPQTDGYINFSFLFSQLYYMIKIKYIEKNMRLISKLDFMSHYLSHLIAYVRHN